MFLHRNGEISTSLISEVIGQYHAMATMNHSNASNYVTWWNVLIPSSHLTNCQERWAPIHQSSNPVSWTRFASTFYFVFLFLWKIHSLLHNVKQFSIVLIHCCLISVMQLRLKIVVLAKHFHIACIRMGPVAFIYFMVKTKIVKFVFKQTTFMRGFWKLSSSCGAACHWG